MENQEQKDWEQEKKRIHQGFNKSPVVSVGQDEEQYGQKEDSEDKKKSFLIEKLATISVSASALYSVFSDSYFGWVVVGLVVLLYFIYKLNKKKIGEDGESAFGFMKSKFRKTALKDEMSKKAYGRDKMMQKLDALKKQKKVKFKGETKELDELDLKKGKGRGLEKSVEKDRLGVGKGVKKDMMGELKKSGQMLGGQSVGVQGKNQRLNELDKNAVSATELKQQLEKRISEKLVKERGLRQKDANRLALSLVAGISPILGKIVGNVIEATTDLVGDVAEQVIKNAGNVVEKAGQAISKAGQSVVRGTKDTLNNLTTGSKASVDKRIKGDAKLARKVQIKEDGRGAKRLHMEEASKQTFTGRYTSRKSNQRGGGGRGR